jgi:hypothetical protein
MGKLYISKMIGDRSPPTTDFPNFFFGRTSRQDLWSKLGGTGIFFNHRDPIFKEADGSFSTTDIYGIANTELIVAFITTINDATSRSLLSKGKAYFEKNLWKSMLLSAIIVAKRDYIESIWGEYAGASKGYHSIALEALQPQTEMSVIKKTDEIHLSNRNGVKTVPVKINDRLILDVVVDSGAADVTIPDYVFLTLLSTGSVSKQDFMNTSKY